MDAGAGRPALLLDRDGTLIEERHFVGRPEHVHPVPGVGSALASAVAAGYALVVVTNQSGIARGYFDEEAFAATQRRLEDLLAADGVHLDGVYHCPHHPDFTGPCECRKPAAGMFLAAARDLGLDLGRSVLVGDRVRDVAAARELGARGMLVRTGFGAEEEERAPPWVEVVPDVPAAVARLLGNA